MIKEEQLDKIKELFDFKRRLEKKKKDLDSQIKFHEENKQNDSEKHFCIVIDDIRIDEELSDYEQRHIVEYILDSIEDNICGINDKLDKYILSKEVK